MKGEAFNSRLRDGRLNEEVFSSLGEARQILAKWRYDDNHVRPHLALGGMTPASARRSLKLSEGSAPGALATPTEPDYKTAGLTF